MTPNPFNRVARPDEFEAHHGPLKQPHPLVTDALLAGQAHIRAWEYSQAFASLDYWCDQQREGDEVTVPPLRFADVGGAGSGFAARLCSGYDAYRVHLIDPNARDAEGVKAFPLTLREYVATRAGLATDAELDASRFDAVFCLSVLEHVKPEYCRAFLHDLWTLVRPGGLLVLTCDFAPALEPESLQDYEYHFHWMREWMPREYILQPLLGALHPDAGAIQLDWHGPTCYNYSVASIALVKPEPDARQTRQSL